MTNLPGVTFAFQRVTPTADASFQAAVLKDGILKGCGMTISGFTLTVRSGFLIVSGRIINIDETKNISVAGAVSGFARVVITIDLTRTASVESFNQVSMNVEYASSEGGFSSLIQENINTGTGTKYQAVLATVALSSSGITSLTGIGNARPVFVTNAAVTLLSSGWNNKAQTVTVEGVRANKDVSHVIVSCDPSNNEKWEAWSNCDVRCVSQGSNRLTFRCTSAPTVDLVANVIIL